MTPADTYVSQQALLRASLLVAGGAFPAQDCEDLQQDIHLDYLHRSRKFDAARSEWRSFVRGITRNCAIDLLTRKRRTAERELLAADIFVGQGVERETDAISLFDSRRFDEEQSLQLRIDVRRVLDALPLKLQNVAILLGQMPVVKACDRLGISRSYIYQIRRQLRDAFDRAGFRPWCTGNRQMEIRRSPKSSSADRTALSAGVRC
jgi:RNA polymerase sigma factor (sigma-70 family)